jgi:hypothetical protein
VQVERQTVWPDVVLENERSVRAELCRERGGQPGRDSHDLRQQARIGVVQIPDVRDRQDECVEAVLRSLP